MSEAASVLEGWESATLADLAGSITSGATPEVGNPRYYTPDGGYAFAKIEDLTRARSREIEYCGLQITDAALRETAAKVYPAGTILLSMYGTIGLAKVCARSLAANQALCALLPPFRCDPAFLLHHLDYVRPQWSRYSGQTTQANINGAIVRAHEVPLPPTGEQVAIRQVFDTLDNTIRQTEAIIEKLKQVKQGLLHDLLTRGIDANGELRPPQNQAPHLYKDSPLGWIPREWSTTPLGELAEVDRGKFTHRPRNDPAFYGGRYPFIQTGDVANAVGGYVSTYSQTLSERGVTVSQEFPAGTVAITIAANIADTAILAVPMYFPDSVVGAIVAPSANTRFVELSIRRAKPQLNARAPQSAQKNINLQDLRPLLIRLPSKAEQDAIAERYEAVQLRLDAEAGTAKKLREAKSGLMDDLLSGRVRVTPLLPGSGQSPLEGNP